MDLATNENPSLKLKFALYAMSMLEYFVFLVASNLKTSIHVRQHAVLKSVNKLPKKLLVIIYLGFMVHVYLQTKANILGYLMYVVFNNWLATTM